MYVGDAQSKLSLLNRSFYVNNENSKSPVFELLYGIPQVSILGPLLFILPCDSACNFGVIIDKNLSFAISKSCFHNIQDLRRIRNTIDQTTAWTIVTSFIHSKIDFCNTLLLNLRGTQTNRRQLVLSG